MTYTIVLFPLLFPAIAGQLGFFFLCFDAIYPHIHVQGYGEIIYFISLFSRSVQNELGGWSDKEMWVTGRLNLEVRIWHTEDPAIVVHYSMQIKSLLMTVTGFTVLEDTFPGYCP